MSGFKKLTILLPLFTFGVTGCQPPEPTDPTVDASASASERQASPLPVQNKPSAPVTVEHEVLGRPTVGQPTEIELSFASSEADATVTASYRIADPAALSFVEMPRDKMPVAMQRANGGGKGLQRLWIRPHSEGRHYLNVLTEIETAAGSLSKSTSIPIDVAGLGAQLQNKQVQQMPEAEPQVDSAGEAIISMPARRGGD